MKLYATVTSERATKGQGGEYLDIELKDEERVCFATIKVRTDRLDGQSVTIWHDGLTDVRTHKDSAWNREIYEYRKTKGEKQKGEYCNECMATPCHQQ
jgi:hypothetical protein